MRKILFYHAFLTFWWLTLVWMTEVVTWNYDLVAKVAILTGIQTNKTKTEIETHEIITDTETRNWSL